MILWGFANAADRQRMEAFVRRGVRSGFYSANSPNVAELVCDSDDNLFQKVLNNQNHVLHQLLPEHQLMTITWDLDLMTAR